MLSTENSSLQNNSIGNLNLEKSDKMTMTFKDLSNKYNICRDQNKPYADQWHEKIVALTKSLEKSLESPHFQVQKAFPCLNFLVLLRMMSKNF